MVTLRGYAPGLMALIGVLLIGLMLAGPVASAWAQDAEGPSLEIVEVRTDGFPRIVVRLNATAGRTSQAAGLGPEQFRVFEDGQPLAAVGLYQLRGPATPALIVLALDTSGSMASEDRLPSAREAARRFVSELRPGDRAAVVSFGSQVVVNQPFTTDRSLLLAAINRLSPGGDTALYDALGQSIDSAALLADKDTRPSVVLLTDGADTSSRTTLAEATARATQAGVPVYTIGLGTDARGDVLQQIATETGGRYYLAPAARDLAETFRLIARQLHSQYELYWESKAQGAPDDDVPVNITLASGAGVGTAAGFTYRRPAFARPKPATLVPLNLSQALIEIPRPVLPSDTLMLIAGGLTGLSASLLLGGYVVYHHRRRMETRLAVFLGGRMPVELGLFSAFEAPQLAVGRAQVGTLTTVLARLAALILPHAQIRRLQRKLAQAGFAGDRNLAVFLATEVLLGVLLGVLSYLVLRQGGTGQRLPILALIAPIAFVAFGFYMPWMWLRRRVEARQRALMRALPDALDLMSIGVSAGLSLDSAMLEVVQKWDDELSRELLQVLNEIRMGIGRRQALLNLAERTQIDDLRLLVAALVQADEIGSNVSDTLNVQAEQLRIRRRLHAEERARKAPVKMLVPLIFLIFPALFIVILAPAMLQVAQTLRRLSGGG